MTSSAVRAKDKQKWLSVSFGMLAMLLGGTLYSWGSYSDTLKQDFFNHSSSSDVEPGNTTVSTKAPTPSSFSATSAIGILYTICLTGNYLPFCGFFFERYGPQKTILFGALLASTGYALLFIMAQYARNQSMEGLLLVTTEDGDVVLSTSYYVAAFACFLFGHASGYFDAAALWTNMKNLPEHRGLVAGLLKSFYGLSAAIMMSILNGFLGGNASILILFLAISALVIGISASFMVKLSTKDIPDERDAMMVVGEGERERLTAKEEETSQDKSSKVTYESTRTTSINVASRLKLGMTLVIILGVLLFISSLILLTQGKSLSPLTKAMISLLHILYLIVLLTVIVTGPPKWFSIWFRESFADKGNHHHQTATSNSTLGRRYQYSNLSSSEHKQISSSFSYEHENKRSDLVPSVLTTLPDKGIEIAREDNTKTRGGVASTSNVSLSRTKANSFVTKDYTAIQALQTPEFYLLFFAILGGMGCGLMIIKEITPILQTRIKVDNTTTSSSPSSKATIASEIPIAVQLLSIFNCFGRMGSGFLSDYFFLRLSRPYFLAFALSLMIASTMILNNFGKTINAWTFIGICLGGYAYGSFWSLTPSIASELFGLKYIGGIYSMQTLAPTLGSYLFVNGIADPLYQAAMHHSGQSGNNDEKNCHGSVCYRKALNISAITVSFSLICALLLAYISRKQYIELRLRGGD
eukprot:g1836.t1